MKLKNISFDKIKITGGFWAEKQALVRNAAMMTVYNRFDDTGRIGAFACDWKEGMDKKPHFFWDSDVAKWIESVAYVTKLEKSEELEALADAIIDNVEKNQHKDGYFNIYYTVVAPPSFHRIHKSPIPGNSSRCLVYWLKTSLLLVVNP